MRGEGNFAPFCIPSKIVPLKATKKSIKASRSRRALFVNSETFRSDNPTFWSESTHAARGADWQCGRFKGLLLFRPPPESSIDNTAGSRGCCSFVRRPSHRLAIRLVQGAAALSSAAHRPKRRLTILSFCFHPIFPKYRKILFKWVKRSSIFSGILKSQ